MNSFTAISMQSPYHGIPSTVYPTTPVQWKNEMVEMLKSFLCGEPVYVRFTSKCQMREGAIGRIHALAGTDYAVKKNGKFLSERSSYFYRRMGSSTLPPATPAVTFKVDKDTYEIYDQELGTMWPTIVWDGRKNQCSAAGAEIEWLKGYSGPTEWRFGKKEKPAKPAYDRLGREIQVGDFTCYILHHFGHIVPSSWSYIS